MSVNKTYLGNISFHVNGGEVQTEVTVHTPFEVHHTGIEKLKTYVKKKFEEIAKSFNLNGLELTELLNGNEAANPEVVKKVQNFWIVFSQVAEKFDARKFLPEVDTAAIPEHPFRRPGIGTAVFSQITPPKTDPIARMESDSPFSQVGDGRIPTRRELARMVVEKEARRQGYLKEYETYEDVLNKRVVRKTSAEKKRVAALSTQLKESEKGVYQSLWSRDHYGQDLSLEKPMTDFGLEKELSTIDRFAHLSNKNGLQFTENGKTYTVDGALAASFDRFATTPTMARKVEDRTNGSSILYAGRVGISTIDGEEQVTAMAKDEVRLVFFGEIDTFEKSPLLAKGLSVVREGDREIHQLQLVDQSLLSMSGQEKKNYEKMVQAFGALSAGEPIELVHPVTGKIYFVRVKPVPAPPTQFNVFTTLDQLLASDWSGRTAELEAANREDAELKTVVNQTLVDKFREFDQLIFTPDPKTPLSPLQKLVQDLLPKFGGDKERVKHEIFLIVKDTFDGIQSRTLEPWQEVLGRQLVCHLAGLPLVTHCQSSVDRTGIAVALGTALQHWLKGTQQTIIPKINERYAIWEVVNEGPKDSKGKVQFHPFRELVLFNCIKGNKCAEYSRMDPGLKWTAHWTIPDFGLHPALQSILPLDVMERPLFREFTSRTVVPLMTLAIPFPFVVTAWTVQSIFFCLGGFLSSSYRRFLGNLTTTIGKTLWNIGKVNRQPIFYTDPWIYKKLREWGLMKIDTTKRRKLLRGMGAVDLKEG